MLLLLQVAAFCQLFFLPGLLIMYLLRFRPDPLFLPPLAFSLSGVFNYVLVMLLSVAGIFCREAMLTLLIAECGLLGVFLCRNGLHPCGGRMREELRILREGGADKGDDLEVSDEIDYALNDMKYNPHDDAPVVDTIDTEGKEEQTQKKEHPVVSDEIDYALNDMQYNPYSDAPVVDTIDTKGKEEQK